MIFLPIETELFYYEHLLDSSDNLRLIKEFCVANESGFGLERYLKEFARQDEESGAARTYLVKDKITHEIVAYYSLKSGLFTVDAGEGYFYSISAVELSNFAVNSSYRKKIGQYGLLHNFRSHPKMWGRAEKKLKCYSRIFPPTPLNFSTSAVIF